MWIVKNIVQTKITIIKIFKKYLQCIETNDNKQNSYKIFINVINLIVHLKTNKNFANNNVYHKNLENDNQCNLLSFIVGII